MDQLREWKNEIKNYKKEDWIGIFIIYVVMLLCMAAESISDIVMRWVMGL